MSLCHVGALIWERGRVPVGHPVLHGLSGRIRFDHAFSCHRGGSYHPTSLLVVGKRRIVLTVNQVLRAGVDTQVTFQFHSRAS